MQLGVEQQGQKQESTRERPIICSLCESLLLLHSFRLQGLSFLSLKEAFKANFIVLLHL